MEAKLPAVEASQPIARHENPTGNTRRHLTASHRSRRHTPSTMVYNPTGLQGHSPSLERKLSSHCIRQIMELAYLRSLSMITSTGSLSRATCPPACPPFSALDGSSAILILRPSHNVSSRNSTAIYISSRECFSTFDVNRETRKSCGLVTDRMLSELQRSVLSYLRSFAQTFCWVLPVIQARRCGSR